MVAFFDSIPKHVTQMMRFSGRVEDSAAWAHVLRQTLKQRLSSWTFAVVSGRLTQEMLLRRNEALEITQAKKLIASYSGYLLPLIDRDVNEGKTLGLARHVTL
jgi:hypothetical protein